MAQRKAEFLTIGFQHNETLIAFADRFSAEAHVLIEARVLTECDISIALTSAVKPYYELFNALALYLEVDVPLLKLIQILCQLSATSFHPV